MCVVLICKKKQPFVPYFSQVDNNTAGYYFLCAGMFRGKNKCCLVVIRGLSGMETRGKVCSMWCERVNVSQRLWQNREARREKKESEAKNLLVEVDRYYLSIVKSKCYYHKFIKKKQKTLTLVERESQQQEQRIIFNRY